MRVSSVLRESPASYTLTHIYTQSHTTHHPSSKAICSPPETSAPSASWDISGCIHPCISLSLLLYLSVHLPTFLLKLHHLSFLCAIIAHDQHLSTSSCISPLLHLSQCSPFSRWLTTKASLCVSPSLSLPPSFSVNHLILVSFPLNRTSLWGLLWLTFVSSQPSTLSPSNPIVVSRSHSPYQSICPDQMASVALSVNWTSLWSLPLPPISPKSPLTPPLLMANHSLYMGVSTPLPCTHTALLLSLMQ